MTTDAERVRSSIVADLRDERNRQEQKFGPNPFARIGPWETLAVLTEELGEIAQCCLQGRDTDHLRQEITHLAACCVAWLETLSTERS